MSERPDPQEVKRLAREMTHKLAAEGKLIEGGWLGFKLATMDPRAGPAQCEDMRSAFYAGAHHLFSSILTFLGPGTEPTEQDLNRLTLVAQELNAFLEDYKKRHKIP